MDELGRGVPPGLVEIECVLLGGVVSLDKTLVVKEPVTVVRGGVLAVKTDGVTLLSGSDREVKESPHGCEDELGEILDGGDMSLMQPHLVLDVMAGFVASASGCRQMVV